MFDDESRRRLRSASSSSLAARRTCLFFNYWRPIELFSAVEHSSAERHVGAVTNCFVGNAWRNALEAFQSFIPPETVMSLQHGGNWYYAYFNDVPHPMHIGAACLSEVRVVWAQFYDSERKWHTIQSLKERKVHANKQQTSSQGGFAKALHWSTTIMGHHAGGSALFLRGGSSWSPTNAYLFLQFYLFSAYNLCIFFYRNPALVVILQKSRRKLL